MLTLEFSMNIIVLLAIIAASFYAGFKLRSSQIAKSRMLVSSLEKEMINNHTEILELHKEYVELKMKFDAQQTVGEFTKRIVLNESTEKSPHFSPANNPVNRSLPDPSRKEAYQLNFHSLPQKEIPLISVQ